jgi:hypothetical protein
MTLVLHQMTGSDVLATESNPDTTLAYALLMGSMDDMDLRVLQDLKVASVPLLQH